MISHARRLRTPGLLLDLQEPDSGIPATPIQQCKVAANAPAHARAERRRLTRAHGPTSHGRRLHLKKEQSSTHAYQAHQATAPRLFPLQPSNFLILFPFCVPIPTTNDKWDRSAASFIFFFFLSTTIQPKHVTELFYKDFDGERAQGVRDVAFSSLRRLFTTTRNTAIDSEIESDPGLGRGGGESDH